MNTIDAKRKAKSTYLVFHNRYLSHWYGAKRRFFRLLTGIRLTWFFRKHLASVWLGGPVIGMLDLRLTGRGFESQPLHCRVQPWASC